MSISPPTISIVIPAYNAESTILETVESVQQQTFSDIEIILINDGSTDRTLELLQKIEDDRLKIFSYENGGLSVARNRGIANATGEFISFIDADDLWTPDKLELQLGALKSNPQAGVAYSWTYYFSHDPQKDSYLGNSVNFSGDVFTQLLLKNFMASSGSNPLIRRKAIESVGGFDPALNFCEDWDFYLRLAVDCFFVVVPKYQIFYRQSVNSLSSQVEAMEKGGLLAIEKAYKVAPLKFQHLKNQSLAWLYLYCTQQYLKKNVNNIDAVIQAGRRLWIATRLHPPILFGDYGRDLTQWLIKKWILVLLAQGEIAINRILLLNNKNK